MDWELQAFELEDIFARGSENYWPVKCFIPVSDEMRVMCGRRTVLPLLAHGKWSPQS